MRGRLIPVSEVKKHKTADDAWTVVRGKVYDITPYLRFHPGGNYAHSLSAPTSCLSALWYRRLSTLYKDIMPLYAVVMQTYHTVQRYHVFVHCGDAGLPHSTNTFCFWTLWSCRLACSHCLLFPGSTLMYSTRFVVFAVQQHG